MLKPTLPNRPKWISSIMNDDVIHGLKEPRDNNDYKSKESSPVHFGMLLEAVGLF